MIKYKKIPSELRPLLDSPDSVNYQIAIQQAVNYNLSLKDIIYYLLFNKKDWNEELRVSWAVVFYKFIFDKKIRLRWVYEDYDLKIYPIEGAIYFDWNSHNSVESTVMFIERCIIDVIKELEINNLL